MERITAQEIQFLQVHGFFKPFGQSRQKVSYQGLEASQKTVVDSLIEKQLLEVYADEVIPRHSRFDIPGWTYCTGCGSKSQSRLLMYVHARNSDHMATSIPQPAMRYVEIRTP